MMSITIIAKTISLPRHLSHPENICQNHPSFVRHFHEEERICKYRVIIFSIRITSYRFHHLGVETDSALTKNHRDIFVIQKTSSCAASQVHKKDLEKFLGVPPFTLSKHSSNRKNLSSFLGVHRKELDRVLKGSSLNIYRNISNIQNVQVDSECGEGSSVSTDSSSVWSSS